MTELRSYGLATLDEFVQEEALFQVFHYHPPAMLVDRIPYLVGGTLKKMGRTPDIVEWQTVLWDTKVRSLRPVSLTRQHWSEIDRRTPGLGDDAVTKPFSQERIDWYHERLEKAFDVMERTFPNSQIVWRRPHEPGCGRFDTPCMRVVQYGQVADYVVSKRPHIRVNQFAKLVRACDAQRPLSDRGNKAARRPFIRMRYTPVSRLPCSLATSRCTSCEKPCCADGPRALSSHTCTRLYHAHAIDEGAGAVGWLSVL